LVASDAVSAQVNARLAGERVEDLSQRTVDSSTFALPDGSWELAQAPGQVWMRLGGDGTQVEDWAAVDATLQDANADDGVWFAPAAQAGDIKIAGARQAVDGVSVVAQATDPITGVTSELTFPGDLPEPKIAGPRATYSRVAGGMDMVVQVTGTGVEQFFVVTERPAADPDLADLVTGVRAVGDEATKASVTARVPTAKTGDVAQLVTADDRIVASVAVPLMWDAAYDATTGTPVTEVFDPKAEPGVWTGTAQGLAQTNLAMKYLAEQEADEEGSEPQLGVVVPVTTSVEVSGTQAVLTLAGEATADAQQVAVPQSRSVEEFLADPAVEYPVVVDPSVSLTVSHDTYVQTGLSSPQSTSTELRVGTYDGTNKARSFIHVRTNPIKGKKIVSAQLSLYQFHSWSCTERQWQVWQTDLSTTSTMWGNQPAWIKQWAKTSDTRGYGSGCPAGTSSVTITDLAQEWADSSGDYKAIGLQATSEGDTYSWKRFRSADASSGKPTVSVTYNSYPNTPGATSRPSSQYTWWPSSTATNRQLFVKTKKPTYSSVVSDPDGGNVKALFDVLQGTTKVWDAKPGTTVASGGTSTFTPTSNTEPLSEGVTYTTRVWAMDASVRSKSPKTLSSFVVDVTKPTTPTITASGYSDGEWKDQAPTSNTLTFKSNSTDAVKFEYTLDGGAARTVAASGSTPTATVSWNPGSGSHEVKVSAIDKAGWKSGTRTLTFGNGGAAMKAPVTGVKSTDVFQVTASAPKASTGTVTPSIWYRAAGTAEPADYDTVSGSTTGWSKAETLAAIPAGTAASVNARWSAAAAAEALGKSRVPVLLDVQVCFAYSVGSIARCTWNNDQAARSTVVRVPHAFGVDFPTAEAGPGQVALWTGEFNTSVTDVSVPGYVGDLSVSRSYSTQSGTDASSAFGPGWSASFDGTDIGVAGWELVDSTGLDGTIALVDDEGAALIYRQPGNGKVLGKTGTYTPVDSETAEYGGSLRKDGTSSSARIIYTDTDGSVTSYAFAGATTAERVWKPVSVTEPGTAGSTTFTWDTNNRITRVLAPVPAGVTCPASGDLNPGCRAIIISYGTITSGTEVAGQVKQISYTAYDPDKSGGAGMSTVPVATYEYDSSKRLAKITDPRTGLTTSYGYSGTSSSGQPLLTQVTEPGLAPWKLAYGASAQDTKSLLTVHRGNPAGAGDDVQVARFAYDIPRANVAGLPQMTTDTVVAWGQENSPTYGAAVFGQDRPIGSMPGTEDWPYADLQYTDAEGRVLTAATYGAGDWQYSATRYDDGGRITHSWDEQATSQLRAQAAEGELTDEVIGSYATITRYNAELKASTAITWTPNGGTAQTIAAGTVLVPAGSIVTDTWEPARDVDGELVRTRTHTDYDQGAPNSGVNPTTGLAFNLPTTVTTTQADGLSGSADLAVPVATGEPVLSRETTGYNPIDGKPVTDPTSGWILGTATESTTLTGANGTSSSADIVSKTRYDAEGRSVEERRPASSGTDAGTTLTGYYTAGTQSERFTACGSKPQWAGLACLTTTAEPSPTLPVEATTRYSMYLASATSTETRDGVVRTTTTTHDAAGRTVESGTTVTGLPASVPVPRTKTVYDPATGLATATVSLNASGAETGRISMTFDKWGRQTTYTDTDGQSTSTMYDAAGRIGTITDPQREVNYAYNGGDGERRGLPTTIDIQGIGTFTATYNAAGNITSQTMPGQTVTQRSTYDRVGDLSGLDYIATADLGNEDAQPLLSWTILSDIRGRTSTITSSANPGDDNPTGLSRTQQFTYDQADRLATAKDTIGESCTTRDYGFDVRGNRIGLTTTTRTAGEDPCAAEIETNSAKTWTYDSADRIQSGATIDGQTTAQYTYDALGRQTKIPTVDTPNGTAAGDITLGYYDTDAARLLTQGNLTTTLTLDPAGRRAREVTTGGTDDTSTVRHYTDASDNPGWASTTTGTVTTTSWYGASAGGDLGIETIEREDSTAPDTPTTTASLTLADPAGSIATTIHVPSPDAAPQIGTVGTWDEYGNTIASSRSEGAVNYGWLGAKERATNATTGLVLMGARLYNSITGQFTSTDPVAGGNSTAYAYPQDPVNGEDLDGQRFSWRKLGRTAWKHRGTILGVASTAAMFVPGLNIVATGYKVYRAASLAYRGYKMYRAVNKSVRYTRSAIKANRTFQYNRWSARTVVRHGKRGYDSQNRRLTTFTHRGSHNGKSGTFKIVGNHRNGKIYHYGFHRD
jgi:RHS repeat-associated protein